MTTATHSSQTPSGSRLPRVFVPDGVKIPRDYVPLAEGAHALYHLELPPSFEGPLDLLLFLIKRHHLDVFDIPMAFICARYLEQLDVLQETSSMDIASEFLVMAAELMQLKSRMLLPQPETVDGVEEGDPRAELVARLLEYQRFREAARELDELPQEGRDTFSRQRTVPEASREQEALMRIGIMALTRALGEVLARQTPEVRHRVVVEQVPMRRRMLRLLTCLKEQERVPLAQMLAEVTERVDIIVMFLAVLELAKLGLLGVTALKSSEPASAEASAPQDDDHALDVAELALFRRFEDADEAISFIAGVDDLAYAG